MALNYFRLGLGLFLVLALLYAGVLDPDTLIRQRRAATGKSYKSLLYWGQNRLGVNLYPGDPKRQEPSLATMCKLTEHDYIVVAFVMTYFSTNDMPGVDFSTHCTKPFYAASLSDPLYKNRQKMVMLSCPDIGDDVKACQAMGKKVFIGIQPLTSALPGDAEGVKFAQNIWNLFLGGTGDRPFGAGVVFDGVDVVLHNNDVVGTAAMSRELRRLINTAPLQYTLMASPRCSFPDSVMGPDFPNRPLTESPILFDIVNVHFRYSTDCSYNHVDWFYSSLAKWSDWTTLQNRPMMITVTSSSNSWVGGSPGDFITAEQYTTEKVAQKLQSTTALIGMGFWDGSGEYLSRPCNNTDITYGSYVRRLLNGQTVDCSYVIEKEGVAAPPGDADNSGGGSRTIFTAAGTRLVPGAEILMVISLLAFMMVV